MALHYTKRGSGITAGWALTLSGSARDIGDTLRRAADMRTFEGLSGEVEDKARAYLRKIGVDPDHHQDYVRFDERQRPLRGYEEDSTEDFCHRILFWIECAREARLQRDFDGFGRAAFQVGILLSAYNLKVEWEKPALAGKKSSEGAKVGGNNRAKSLKDRNLRMGQEFDRRRATTKLSDTALSADIGRKEGLRKTASVAAVAAGRKTFVRSGAKPDK